MSSPSHWNRVVDILLVILVDDIPSDIPDTCYIWYISLLITLISKDGCLQFLPSVLYSVLISHSYIIDVTAWRIQVNSIQFYFI